MIEKLVTRAPDGLISGVFERPLGASEEGAVSTWRRIRDEVLPVIAPPPGAVGRIEFPISVTPAEVAGRFAAELRRVVLLDGDAWRAWAIVAFRVNGELTECRHVQGNHAEVAGDGG